MKKKFLSYICALALPAVMVCSFAAAPYAFAESNILQQETDSNAAENPPEETEGQPTEAEVTTELPPETTTAPPPVETTTEAITTVVTTTTAPPPTSPVSTPPPVIIVDPPVTTTTAAETTAPARPAETTVTSPEETTPEETQETTTAETGDTTTSASETTPSDTAGSSGSPVFPENNITDGDPGGGDFFTTVILIGIAIVVFILIFALPPIIRKIRKAIIYKYD